MNWLDIVILVLLGFAALNGFTNGFMRGLASLVAWVLGIWAAIHFSDRLAGWIGLGPERTMLAFLITFFIVMALVHLLGRAMTTAIDAAQLSLPNKVAGGGFGVLRQAFVLSVLLNLSWAMPQGSTGSLNHATEGSLLAGPLRSFAPLLVPAIGEAKWVRNTIDQVQEEVLEEMGK